MSTSEKPTLNTIIKKIAKANQWSIEEIEEDEVHLLVESDGGNEYDVFASLDEELVEFYVPSSAVFEKEADIPGKMSTLLLKRNAQLDYGTWVLEEIDGQWVYGLVYDEHLENLASLSEEDVADFVESLVDECDVFERVWEKEQK
jgi:hypothetical protein